MNLHVDGIIVAVSGGRDYADRGALWRALDQLNERARIGLVIQGECTTGGADELARLWAKARDVNCLSVPAKWRHGPGAGPIRNHAIGVMRPDVWLLAPGGKGTASARSVAIRNKIKRIELEPGHE